MKSRKEFYFMLHFDTSLQRAHDKYANLKRVAGIVSHEITYRNYLSTPIHAPSSHLSNINTILKIV